jgi:hypothetical protein
VFAIFLLVTNQAIADICQTPTDVHMFCGGVNWTQPQSCYTTQGVYATAAGCSYYDPNWTFADVGGMYARISFNADSRYMASNWWEAGSFFETVATGNSNDYIDLWAYVYHTDGTATYNHLFHWDGTMAGLNGCNNQYGVFYAAPGDLIVVQLLALNVSGTTIKATVPRIFSDSCT